MLPEALTNLTVSVLPLVLFFGLLLLILKFSLRKSHDGMDTSIDMQKEAMQGQADAIEMTREALELQKETLSEMREIRKLLEKR